jgi:S1-C subfamily serine protease
MKTSSGLLEVVDVDSLKIAYSAGLMIGDRIRRVNGENVRNARSLMGKILDKIDTDGVYMEVLRDDQEIGLLLLPEPEF